MPLYGHRKKLRLKICPESAPNSLIAPIYRSGAYGIRTRDLLNAIEALYQLS